MCMTTARGRGNRYGLIILQRGKVGCCDRYIMGVPRTSLDGIGLFSSILNIRFGHGNAMPMISTNGG